MDIKKIITIDEVTCIFDAHKIADSRQIQNIGTLEFMDCDVTIYYDPLELNKDSLNVVWKARNPDSFYTGVMYRNNETGKITYPNDAVIPKQTPKDREIIPKAIIVANPHLTDILIYNIQTYLHSEFKRRNKK